MVRSTHEGIVEEGIYYLSNVFKYPVVFPIVEIIKVIDIFPRCIT